MVDHSSILAWRILWTEETGGLQSVGVTQSQSQLEQLSMHAACGRRCVALRQEELQSSGLFRLESQGLRQELPS